MLAAYTYLVAKAHPSLVVNAVSPGFVDTDLTAGMTAAGKQTPAQAAVPLVYLLMDEQVAHKPTQGLYYGSDGKRSPWAVTRNPGTPEYEGPYGPSPASR